MESNLLDEENVGLTDDDVEDHNAVRDQICE